MAYLTRLLLPQVQKGLAAVINQFFAGYPTLTILDASAVRVQGVVGAEVTCTGNGTRHFAAEFASTTSAQACQQIEAFLIANPSVVPVRILDLSTPNRRQAIRDRFLLIYSNAISKGGAALPQGALSAGVVGDAQILGAYGDPRGLVSLRSLGDASWPVGGRGIAWRSRSTGTWGGVGRRTYTGTPPAFVTSTTSPTTARDPKCCGGPTDPVPTTPPNVVNSSSTTAFPVSSPPTTPGWATPATPSSSTPTSPTTSVPMPWTTAPTTTSGTAPTFTVPTTPYSPFPVATPTFSPNGGVVLVTDPIAIACATSGATIHYTVDGSTPTAASPVYGGSFTISATTTVKAMAVKAGYRESSPATANFIVNVVDPSLWVGAWDFSSDPDPNKIAARPGAAAPLNGATISGGSANLPYGGLVSAYTDETLATMQWSVSFQVGVQATGLSVAAFASSTTSLIMYFGTNNYIVIDNDAVFGYDPGIIASGDSGHIVVVRDRVSMTVKIYKNGALYQTLALNPFGSINTFHGLNRFAMQGGQTLGKVTNLTMYRGILSSAAISALAGGAMPDANGNL